MNEFYTRKTLLVNERSLKEAVPRPHFDVWRQLAQERLEPFDVVLAAKTHRRLRERKQRVRLSAM